MLLTRVLITLFLFTNQVLTQNIAIDLVQEHVFKAGPQTNESAAEQAKDKFIADTIRDGYEKATGKDFPIAAKKEEENKITAGLGGLAGKLFK